MRESGAAIAPSAAYTGAETAVPFQTRGASNPHELGYDEPTDADNPNGEFFGVAAEPWQDFNDSNAVKSRTGPSRTSYFDESNKANIGDMESILRGGRRAQGENTSAASPAPVNAGTTSDGVPGNYASSPVLPGVDRSKTMLNRFRKRVDANVPARGEAGTYAQQASGTSEQGASASYTAHPLEQEPMQVTSTSRRGYTNAPPALQPKAEGRIPGTGYNALGPPETVIGDSAPRRGSGSLLKRLTMSRSRGN